MFTESEIDSFQLWLKNLNSKAGIKSQHIKNDTEREIWLKNNPCPISEKIIDLYDKGHGYKTLAKNLNISYTKIRNVCAKLEGFKPRKGQNVVTDILKKTRSENAKGEKSNWFDWANRKPYLMKNSNKGICGFYIRKHDHAKIWLRSTYEYIYAKWLDKLNTIWKYEVKSFKLSNGESYRPDFFIYDDMENLQCIVEIKSRYYNQGNREYKFHMFKKEYDIECSIFTDITPFLEKGTTYGKEIKKWKQERLLLEES